MSRFTAIDLSAVAAPDVVETLSFEVIFSEMLADLQERDPEFTALVESDPTYKILEVAAYRELLLRQRINDSARAVMLAYAKGADLDNLAALFGVTRKLLDEGDPDAIPPVDPTYETDKDLRYRAQLSLEGFSTAGPEGAYIFHALSVDGVKDVGVEGPPDVDPGEVRVTILGHDGNGDPDPEIIAAVEEVLNNQDVCPLTDQITVQGADIVTYEIEATIYVLPGPDPETVRAEALASLEAFVSSKHSVGGDIRLSGLYASLHVGGVERVTLSAPGIIADLITTATQAPYCENINLTVDEA